MSEVEHKNILAVLQHSNDTRVMLREDQKLLGTMADRVETLSKKVELLERQVQAMQVKLYTGGATT